MATTTQPQQGELFGEAAQRSGYFPGAPETLLTASRQYFKSHIGNIVEALSQGGASAATARQVQTDYKNICFGNFNFTATPEQMKEAIKAVPPLKAFIIDRYGLFYFLLTNYKDIETAWAEYNHSVKQHADDIERRTRYFTLMAQQMLLPTPPTAVLWLYSSGFMTAQDFDGVPDEIRNYFIKQIRDEGQRDQFAQFVYFARYALNATPEQEQQLTPPAVFASYSEPITAALSYANVVAEEINRHLAQIENMVNEVMTAPTPEETERAKSKANKMASRGVVRIPENMATSLARPLWFYKDDTGKNNINDLNELIPARHIIDQYYISIGRENDKDKITPLMIFKAIEAAHILLAQNPVPCINGIYTLKTTMDQIARCAGYPDANQHELFELLTAFRVLHNTFFVYWLPDGKCQARTILTIREITIDKKTTVNIQMPPEIILEVRPAPENSKYTFITLDLLEDMRKNQKGVFKRRFHWQILSKRNKEENALLDEVFGYSSTIREIKYNGQHTINQIKEAATEKIKAIKEEAAQKMTYARFEGDAAKEAAEDWKTQQLEAAEKLRDDQIKAVQADTARQLKAAQDYKRKHISNDRAKLYKWFDEYTQNGTIKHHTRINKKGQTIHSWERKKPPTADEFKQLQNPADDTIKTTANDTPPVTD